MWKCAIGDLLRRLGVTQPGALLNLDQGVASRWRGGTHGEGGRTCGNGLVVSSAVQRTCWRCREKLLTSGKWFKQFQGRCLLIYEERV